MAVMARESWTDERLDDLKGSMNQRFDDVDRRMDERFKQIDTEMKAGFARVDERFKQVDNEMKAGFARVDERFGEVDRRLNHVQEDVRELRVAVVGMQRAMVHAVIAISAIMLTGFGSLVGMAAF